jgi:hypothetical protein
VPLGPVPLAPRPYCSNTESSADESVMLLSVSAVAGSF